MPLTKTSSPGLSSQPASSEPSMTVSAPATIALAMSPEYCSPPSPMTGTPAGRHALATSWIAVTCGTPTPATTRVVQMLPGPDADLDAVDAGVDQRLRTGAGGDVAAEHLDVAGGRVGLEPPHHVEHQPGLAVGGVGHEHVDAGLDQGRGPLPRVAEEADRRGDPQPALAVLGGVRVLLGLDEVLDRDQPGQPAGAVDQRQLLDLVLGEQRRGVRGRRCRPAR